MTLTCTLIRIHGRRRLARIEHPREYVPQIRHKCRILRSIARTTSKQTTKVGLPIHHKFQTWLTKTRLPNSAPPMPGFPLCVVSWIKWAFNNTETGSHLRYQHLWKLTRHHLCTTWPHWRKLCQSMQCQHQMHTK